MKITFVFGKNGMTVYPSIAMAEKDLGVHALRRTLKEHSGEAHLNGHIVITPETQENYDRLVYFMEAKNEGLLNLFL